jgi:hypothetical protein
MRKYAFAFIACFCLGLLCPGVKAEVGQGFNHYKTASEKYSETKPFRTNEDAGDNGARPLAAPPKPSEPGAPGAPLGNEWAAILLCSCIYVFIITKRKEKA